jgi:5-methylthioadenosine/S-adenosylhomocysteine deaminase
MNHKKLVIIAIIAVAAASVAYYLYLRSRNVDLIIHNGIVVTMNPHLAQEEQIIPHGAVAIRGDSIVAVGATDTITKKYSAKELIDAQGNAVLPGFVNGHCHAAMTLFRGVADGHDLNDWLTNYIFPIEREFVNEDFVYWGTKLSCLEMIAGGITTVVDMYMYEEFAARAFAEMGMRAIAGQTIFKEHDIESATALIKKWHGHKLITPAVAPHAPYTVSQELLIQAHNLAKKYNTPLEIHLAETAHEVDIIKKEYQATPVAYLEHINFLTDRLIAAHLVKVDDHDINLLKKHSVGVIHCPVSNMKLASGIAPIEKMIVDGLHVGVGTDGAASNNSLDIISEMQTAALLQKVATMDPKSLDAHQSLTLATIGGAQAIHQGHVIGSLEAGKKADIVIIDLKGFHSMPWYNILSQLVYSSAASDVETVIINGKIMLHNKKFLYPQAELDSIREHTKDYQIKIASFLAKTNRARRSK